MRARCIAAWVVILAFKACQVILGELEPGSGALASSCGPTRSGPTTLRRWHTDSALSLGQIVLISSSAISTTYAG